MKSFVLLVGFLLVLFFAGEVQSSHYRGGTIFYRPNANSPYSVDFTFRLSFRRGAIYCDSNRVANRLAPSGGWSLSTWRVTRYWSYHSNSSSGIANIYCSGFNAQEDWSEGNNKFTFLGGYSDDWWSVRITDGGDWISGITHSNSYDDMQLEARVNRTISGVFNNSSPVSSLPLTVYAVRGIPSVIRIPVEDPDGDIVRCRNARYQECYRGMCTYFPHGVLDEGNCTLSYNGGGSVGQLFPIILKLEDFPSGTMQFDSSNSSLASVDLQFVVHIVNPLGMNTDFNTLGSWRQATNDIFDWTLQTGCTSSTATGPCSDHTGSGKYAYIEASSPRVQGNNARLTFSGSYDGDLCMTFYYHMYGISIGSLKVYDNGNVVLSLTGNKGNAWFKQQVDLSSNRNVVIEGVVGSSYEGDIAIDDISVTRGRCASTDLHPCNSNPCRNGATCRNDYLGGYSCSCRYGYTGQQCQSYVNFCASWPCRNGGTCTNNYNHGYNCYCPYGFTGRQCETNLKTSVTCGENFMQIDLIDRHFPGLDWRTLHLKNTTCRATKTAYTMRLRAPLDGCGVTYVEHDKKITFWNEVRNELVLWPGWGGNLSAITRGENLVIPFYCEYGREKIVSTNFNPSKKRVYASEGSYGNFTFTMDLYYTSSYRTPYSVFAYPVVVYPNQPLWVQYEVKNTNADLVVFAENCRATTTTNPDSFPQHVFLKRGCVRDPTMVYWYNPYSNVQRFSIRSFRFVYSNTFLVYLHCELIVCHRNSTNSRCAQGCISSRKRREADTIDGSNTYGLSAGPLKGPNTQTGTDQQGGEETSSANTATIGSVSALAVVGLLVAIVLSIKMYHARRNRVPPKETPPPAIVMGETLDMSQTVNSYEQHVMEDGERMEIEI